MSGACLGGGRGAFRWGKGCVWGGRAELERVGRVGLGRVWEEMGKVEDGSVGYGGHG